MIDVNKIISAVKPIVAVVAGIFAIYFFMENRYAHREPDFKNLEQRLNEVENNYVRLKPVFTNLDRRVEMISVTGSISKIDERIWELQKGLKKSPSNKSIVDEINHLEADKKLKESERQALLIKIDE